MIAQVKDTVLVTVSRNRAGRRSNDVLRETSLIDSNQLIPAGMFMLRDNRIRIVSSQAGIAASGPICSLTLLRHMVTAPVLTFQKLTA